MAGGVTVRYRARRFLPRAGSTPVKRLTAMAELDRVDLVAARDLGSPLAWWKVCDANLVLSPSDLEREPGLVIRIPDDAPHLLP